MFLRPSSTLTNDCMRPENTCLFNQRPPKKDCCEPPKRKCVVSVYRHQNIYILRRLVLWVEGRAAQEWWTKSWSNAYVFSCVGASKRRRVYQTSAGPIYFTPLVVVVVLSACLLERVIHKFSGCSGWVFVNRPASFIPCKTTATAHPLRICTTQRNLYKHCTLYSCKKGERE